jgi:hypothetical protein
LFVLALCGRARAQEDTDAAAAAFDEGARAFAARDYQRAARSFEQAFALAPAGSAAFNAGLAWQAAGEDGRAADAYEIALADTGLEAKERGVARARLASLEPKLGLVVVTGPAGALVSLAHAQRKPVPLRVHAAPGVHQLQLQHPSGAAEARQIEVAAGQTLEITFGAEPAPPAKPAAQPPLRPTAPTRRAPPPAADQGTADPRPWVGGALLGVAALSTGAAIYLGVRTLDARDEYLPQQTDDDLYERADDLRTATNVAWIGAGVTAAAGVSILVWSWAAPRKPTSAATPSATLDLARGGLALRGRY